MNRPWTTHEMYLVHELQEENPKNKYSNAHHWILASQLILVLCTITVVVVEQTMGRTMHPAMVKHSCCYI